MKSTKKVLSIMCLALCTVLLFVACADTSGTTPDPTETPKTTVAPTPTQEPEAKVHKLRIMGPSAFANFVKWDDRENYASWQLFDEQLKERNIELEYDWIVPEQYTTVIQTRMAGAVDLPDIANISALDDMTAISLGMSGTILDVNGLIEQYSDGTIETTYEEGDLVFAKQLTTAPDGKRYWFSNAIASGTIEMPDGHLATNLEVINNAIRKDWLDELNLPVPTTVDEWVDALRAFRENDMNGNGVEDEVLLFDSYSYSFFTGIAQWFGLVPDIIAVDTSSNEVVSPWYQEGVKDYFQLMNELAEEGIFDVSLVGATDEVGSQRIAENKISALRSYAIASWWEELVEGVEAEYIILPPLKAKEGITPFLLGDSADLAFDKFAITKACEDVEGAIKLFDYLFSEDYARVSGIGVQGIDWEYDEEKLPDEFPKSIHEGKTGEEIYKEGKGRMGVFIGGVFPRISKRNLNPTTAEKALENMPNDKQRSAVQRRFDMMEYKPFVTSPFSGTLYSLPSEEELETTNKYYTALKTYSEELAMGLILGNDSLDDWDKHIAKLQELGLDEMIEVYAARYERYMGVN